MLEKDFRVTTQARAEFDADKAVLLHVSLQTREYTRYGATIKVDGLIDRARQSLLSIDDAIIEPTVQAKGRA